MDARDLIGHARSLVRSGKGKPRQVALRRAVSASYYSVFHAFLAAAANDLVGATRQAKQSSAYRLVYRAFEHNSMRALCEHAAKQQLPRRYAEILGSAQFDGAIRVAASNFVRLQESRHLADYDPQFRFAKSDALQAIEQAVTANVMFTSAPEVERRNFLLCMLVPPR